MRGAATAASGLMPKSIMLLRTWRIALRMRFDPPLPVTANQPSSRVIAVGAIIEDRRRSSGQPWGPEGLTSSSPSMLLSIMPVPGTSAPQPSPFDRVTEAALPAASITLMWVVPR
jgi:hypothetical protein